MPFPQIGDYGPYDDWSETETYVLGDVVFYEGYLYVMMGNGTFGETSVGENPRSATFTCKFYDTAEVNSVAEPPATPPYEFEEERTMRRWRVFDLPFSYYQAMLRGIPPDAFTGSDTGSPLGQEVRTINAVGFKKDGQIVNECSYKGYGLSAGLDATYSVSSISGYTINLIYSFSAVPLEKVDEENGYVNPETNQEALFYQPNTVGKGDEYPAWGDDCQGMMFASMQTFGRDYTVLTDYDEGPPETASTANLTTIAFQDNWTAEPVSDPPIAGIPIETDPDFAEP